MKTNIFVNIPPMTDEAGLLGCYGSLLNASNIPNALGSTDGTFSHPVEESRNLIMREFQENNELIVGMASSADHIELLGVKSNGRLITMTFEYK